MPSGVAGIYRTVAGGVLSFPAFFSQCLQVASLAPVACVVSVAPASTVVQNVAVAVPVSAVAAHLKRATTLLPPHYHGRYISYSLQ